MKRYDHQYRALQASIPHPHGLSLRIRQDFAEMALVMHRGSGYGPEDDERVFQQFDFGDIRDYWDCSLSEATEPRLFAHGLSKHFFTVQNRQSVEPHILSALRLARIENESWFIEDLARPPQDRADISTLKLHQRAAATWMMSKPRLRHLVPPSLAAVLRQAIGTPRMQADPQVTLPKNSRGPRPRKLVETARAMSEALSSGKHTETTLRSATEESLVSEFGSSRDTCRKARVQVMSVFVNK